MSKTFRRLIYIFFVLLFLLSVPTVLLYTAGYKYNFRKWRLDRTGVLFLESIPRNATVLLNNKRVRQTTPARLPALLPEDYQIKIQKSGYLSWQKTLAVLPGQTTFANTVFLPKDAGNENFFETTAQNLSLAPSGKIMLLAGRNKSVNDRRPNYLELGFYELENKKYQPVLNLPYSQTPPDLKWLDDKMVVVQSGVPNQFFLLIVGETSPIFLNTEFDAPIHKIELETTQTGVILVRAGRRFWRFNIKNRQKEFVEKYNFDTYGIQGGLIYFMRQDLKNLYLASRPITDKSDGAIKNLLQLKGAKYEFLDSPDGFVLLRSAENITLIKLNPEPRVILQTEAKEGRYFRNGNSLRFLHFTDSEIYVFDVGPETNQLVTRLGTKILGVRPLSDGEHLLILADNKITMVELDNRAERNVWALAEGETIYNFAYNRDDEIIYFVGHLPEQKNGLYQRWLK